MLKMTPPLLGDDSLLGKPLFSEAPATELRALVLLLGLGRYGLASCLSPAISDPSATSCIRAT